MKQQNVITDARNLYLRSPAFESQPNLHLYDYSFFSSLPACAGRVSQNKSTPFLIHHLLLLYHSAHNNPSIWQYYLRNQALINLRVLSFLWVGRIELRACAKHKASTVFRIQRPSCLASQWQESIWRPLVGRKVQIVKAHTWMETVTSQMKIILDLHSFCKRFGIKKNI